MDLWVAGVRRGLAGEYLGSLARGARSFTALPFFEAQC